MHRGVIWNGADEVVFIHQLALFAGAPGAAHGLAIGFDQEDGNPIELQLLAGQQHGIPQQIVLAATAGEGDADHVQRLQHGEEGALQCLTLYQIGLGMEPLVPLLIDLAGEQVIAELGSQIVDKELDALTLVGGEAIDAAAGLQIDDPFQFHVTLERETGA